MVKAGQIKWLGHFPTWWCLLVDRADQLLTTASTGSPSIFPLTRRTSSLALTGERITDTALSLHQCVMSTFGHLVHW